MTRLLTLVVLLLAVALPRVAAAAVDGWWKSIDDETGNIRSIVHIEVINGKARGTIVQLFRQPDEIADPLCTACDAPLNTHKIVGLEIMSGLTADGATWSGGSILDPASGSVYSVFIEELDAGKPLPYVYADGHMTDTAALEAHNGGPLPPKKP